MLKTFGLYDEIIVSEFSGILESAQKELISLYRCENPSFGSSGHENSVSAATTVNGANEQIISQHLISPNLGSSEENLHTNSEFDVGMFERRSLPAQQNPEMLSERDAVELWPDNYDPTDIVDETNAMMPWWEDML